MMSLTRRAAVVCALVVAPLGCKDDPPSRAPTTDLGARDGAADAGFDGRDDAGRVADAGMDAGDAMLALTEGEIAAVVAAVNASEIAQGELAAMQAIDPGVQEFARRMVSEHTDATNELNGIVVRAGITLAQNALSRQVAMQGAEVLATLRLRTGTDFDGGYVNAQIALHAQTVAMLDTALIPSARSIEMRSFLMTLRASVQANLDAARALATRDAGM